MKAESSFSRVSAFFTVFSVICKKRVSMYNNRDILTENLNKFLNEDFYFLGARRCPFFCAI